MSKHLVYGPQNEPLVIDSEEEARSLCSNGVFSMTKRTLPARTGGRDAVGLEEAVCPTCGKRIADEDEEQDEQ
jgi:hypothetical protein